MYPTKPPSRANFSPRVPSPAKMPSPPPALRALVERLNRTPSRAHRATPYIKTEPAETPSYHNSDSEHLAFAPQPRPASQHNNNSDGSLPSSTSTVPSDNSALSQALVNMLNTPPASNTTFALDFRGCRVEIHFHVHPTVRPAFPPSRSPTERLKRKRDSHDVDQVLEGAEVLERQVKKIKLSHGGEIGYRIKGHANTKKRPERVTAADGVKARSRAGARRMSSRGLDADRARR